VTRWLYPSIALTVLALAGSLYVYQARDSLLPEKVPVHWNAEGKANGFVQREDASSLLLYLLLVPAIMGGMVLLTVVLPWLSPKHFEIDRFRGTYGYIMFLIVALCAYIQVANVLGMMERPFDTVKLLIGGMMLFFALLGNVMGKVRRNFYVGVRTPWTLASDAVWEATHRLAAWLMVVGGVAGFIALLLGVPFYCCLIGVLVCVLIPIPYSLWLYKKLEREGKLETPDPTTEVQSR
jgi:uncharacterized membrane protein